MPDLSERLRQAAAEFDRDGFTVLRRFLDADEISRWQAHTEAYVRLTLPRNPKTAFYEDTSDPASLFRIEKLNVHDQAFAGLLRDDRMTTLAKALLHDDVRPQSVQMFGKAPRIGKETPAHQDGYYFQLTPNEALTFWLPLDASDLDNGCVRYVKGSHRQGLRPHGRSAVFGFSQGLMAFADADREQETPVQVQPGDLIAHHSLTIHRADPNTSDRRRWAIGLVYYAGRARRDEAGYQRYLADVAAQQRDLGAERRA